MDALGFYFEAPIFLAAIPALFFFFFLLSGGKRIDASSKALFSRGEESGLKEMFLRAGFFLSKSLIFFGLLLIFIAAADPKSKDYKIVNRIERGRIAVIINDVSGSMSFVMSQGTRMDILKDANKAFIDIFCKSAEDSRGLKNLVGLVSFAGEAQINMTPTHDCEVLKRRITDLKEFGSTAIELGLWTGVALLVEWADGWQTISRDEFERVKASLYERSVYIPENAKEFCGKYRGLSLLLFTDGEFDQSHNSREAFLMLSRSAQGMTIMNPFNIIDFAKSLCIKTYFWSISRIEDSYKDAFENPPGSGLALRIDDADEGVLVDLYESVALMEAGEFVSAKEIEFNPLRKYFISFGIICFLLGLLLSWSKNYSGHSGGGGI